MGISISVNGLAKSTLDIGGQLLLLRGDIYNAGVSVARAAAYNFAEACAEHTPTDTGNLLNNWHIDTSGDLYDDTLLREGSVETPMGARISLQKADPGLLNEVESRLQEEVRKLGSSDVNHILVYNNTPYAGAIDAGKSNQQPRGMTAHGHNAFEETIEKYNNEGFGAFKEFRKESLKSGLLARAGDYREDEYDSGEY